MFLDRNNCTNLSLDCHEACEEPFKNVEKKIEASCSYDDSFVSDGDQLKGCLILLAMSIILIKNL